MFYLPVFLQMFCPIICIVGPVLYLGSMVFLRYQGQLVPFYCCLVGITVFPAVNALLTLAFVAPYRRFTLGWMRHLLKGGKDVVAHGARTSVISVSGASSHPNFAARLQHRASIAGQLALQPIVHRRSN